MPRKGFPQISSLPSFRQSTSSLRHGDQIPRSFESENIKDLPPGSSPFANKSKQIKETENWTPISISSGSDSDNDDERQDKIGNIYQISIPVVLKKQPSMLSLRNRREPQFQGVRTLKPARIVNKAGDRNSYAVNLPEKSARFIKDIAHTLIDVQWRWLLTVFFLTYFGCWLLFAILFYIIGWAHGDLEFDHETGQRLGEGSEECIRGAINFAGFFLLSVESQVSTGYGEKYPTEECPEAIFLLIVQLTIGVAIDAMMVGIVYVKAIRPPKYSDFKFGMKAVICQRDGKLCLIFRVADFEQNHSIDTKLRAYLFEEKITLEGERMGKSQQRLKLENNGRVFLIWPNTVCHIIDKSSPFYDMSARDLIQKRFEIVLSLTGISRHTGQTTQSRTSYLSKEIFWGHRFANVITYDKENGHYVTHVELLNQLEQVDTALCSAQRLDEIIDEVHDALERETEISLNFHDKFDEEEEETDDDDDNYSGLQMIQKSTTLGSSRKFSVTKVEPGE